MGASLAPKTYGYNKVLPIDRAPQRLTRGALNGKPPARRTGTARTRGGRSWCLPPPRRARPLSTPAGNKGSRKGKRVKTSVVLLWCEAACSLECSSPLRRNREVLARHVQAGLTRVGFRTRAAIQRARKFFAVQRGESGVK